MEKVLLIFPLFLLMINLLFGIMWIIIGIRGVIVGKANIGHFALSSFSLSVSILMAGLLFNIFSA